MDIFETSEKKLLAKGYTFERVDFERPWGGFFVIEEKHKRRFIEEYFTDITDEKVDFNLKISPKVLLVAPGKRLSWQYHHRRSELWQVLAGEVAVATNTTDEETEPKTYKPGDQIEMSQGERHRLVGLKEWGIIAEIWIHTDANHPSDENDIVRLQDDFKRV